MLARLLNQETFMEIPFDSSCLNIHAHPSGPGNILVLLVHGFGGGGYKTWKGVPQELHAMPNRECFDVGVFDYPSGHRRPFRNNFDSACQVLLGHLMDLTPTYDRIFVIGHSMGGLIAEQAAIHYIDARHEVGDHTDLPLQAIGVVAAPRAGSWLAAPGLSWFVPDLRKLRKNSHQVKKVAEYFSTRVEIHNLAEVTPARVRLPVFCLKGTQDAIVSAASSGYAIPRSQIRSVDGTHSSVAKISPEQLVTSRWIRDVVRDRLEVTEQVRRQRAQLDSMRSEPEPDRTLVTQLLTDPVGGLDWEEAYSDVLRSVSTDEAPVRDERHPSGGREIHLLLAVHSTTAVLDEDSLASESFEEAARIRSRNPQVTFGAGTVGTEHLAAVATMNSWLVHNSLVQNSHVKGFDDKQQLKEWLQRLILVLLSRRSAQPIVAPGGATSPASRIRRTPGVEA